MKWSDWLWTIAIYFGAYFSSDQNFVLQRIFWNLYLWERQKKCSSRSSLCDFLFGMAFWTATNAPSLPVFLWFKLLAVLTFWIKGAFESTHHCIMSSSSNHCTLSTLDGLNNANSTSRWWKTLTNKNCAVWALFDPVSNLFIFYRVILTWYRVINF
jgi:hypothetical protein